MMERRTMPLWCCILGLSLMLVIVWQLIEIDRKLTHISAMLDSINVTVLEIQADLDEMTTELEASIMAKVLAGCTIQQINAENAGVK